jgi:hypothetical protein
MGWLSGGSENDSVAAASFYGFWMLAGAMGPAATFWHAKTAKGAKAAKISMGRGRERRDHQPGRKPRLDSGSAS